MDHPIFRKIRELMDDKSFLNDWMKSDRLDVGSDFADDFPPAWAAFDKSTDAYIGTSKNSFLKKAKREFEKSLSDAKFTEDGKLLVYRMVTGNKVDSGNLGVYWTWDQEMALPYWGDKKGKNILLEAAINPSDVDIEVTTALALNPFRFEREIRLKPGRSIQFRELNKKSSKRVSGKS